MSIYIGIYNIKTNEVIMSVKIEKNVKLLSSEFDLLSSNSGKITDISNLINFLTIRIKLMCEDNKRLDEFLNTTMEFSSNNANFHNKVKEIRNNNTMIFEYRSLYINIINILKENKDIKAKCMIHYE